MSRQQALNTVWERLLMIFLVIGILAAVMAVWGVTREARVPALIFLFGNLGSYVGIHRKLGELNDEAIIGLSKSWLGLLVPSFVGGILAFVLHLLFQSKIIGGQLFPLYVPDTLSSGHESFEMITAVHLYDASDYAKLLFWSFFAGFNQQYAVDIIESVKTKT